MNRAIRSYLMLLISTLLLACKEDGAKTVQWTLQSHAVPSANNYKELVIMCQKISKMSDGRFIITPLPGDAKAKITGPALYAAVSEGRLEMANAWPNWWSAQHPAWSLLGATPFIFMNLDISMLFFLSDEGTALANGLSSPHNIIWRPAWWAGMEFGLLSREPVNSLADLHHKKVRIGPGIPSELLTAASQAYALPTIPSEIKPAFESGSLDAVEWTTPSGVTELGLEKLSAHAIVPAIWQPSVLSDFLINKQAYIALPESFKAILESALKEYTLITTMKNKRHDFTAMNHIISSGIKINTWSKKDLETWKIKTKELYIKYKKQNKTSNNILNKMESFKNKYNEYYHFFEDYEKKAKE